MNLCKIQLIQNVLSIIRRILLRNLLAVKFSFKPIPRPREAWRNIQKMFTIIMLGIGQELVVEFIHVEKQWRCWLRRQRINNLSEITLPLPLARWHFLLVRRPSSIKGLTFWHIIKNSRPKKTMVTSEALEWYKGLGRKCSLFFPTTPLNTYWHKFVQDLRHKWDENPRFCSRFWRNHNFKIWNQNKKMDP